LLRAKIGVESATEQSYKAQQLVFAHNSASAAEGDPRQLIIPSLFAHPATKKPPKSKMEINPNNLTRISKLMSPATMRRYKKYWMEFIKFSGVTTQVQPTEEMYYSFIEKKRDQDKYCGNTLWAMYSALNKVTQHLYNFKLQVSYILIYLKKIQNFL
jgi:hypothetical protein